MPEMPRPNAPVEEPHRRHPPEKDPPGRKIPEDEPPSDEPARRAPTDPDTKKQKRIRVDETKKQFSSAAGCECPVVSRWKYLH